MARWTRHSVGSLLLGVSLASGAGCAAKRLPGSAANTSCVTQVEWQALPPAVVRVDSAPVTLQGDDGSLASLRAVTVRAWVVPPLAFTELELAFDELGPKSAGATFSAELPRGAAVSRFAVYDGKDFRDAELVDAAAAQGLASPPPTPESDGKERFSLRVLKQAAHAPRLILGYAERLASARTPYRVRLNGLHSLETLQATVDVGEQPGRRFQLDRSHFTPDRDFSLSAEQLRENGEALAWRAGNYLVARIPPPVHPSHEFTFLIDTSASQTLSLDRVSERLVELSQALAREQPDLLLTVVGFDQEIHPLLVRAHAPFTPAQLAPLRALGRLGGTDFTFLDSALRAQGLPSDHLVVLSDLQNSIAPVSRVPGPSAALHTRWDLLASDSALEKKLVEWRERFADSGMPGLVVRLDDEPGSVARRILEPTPSPVRVSVQGATWSVPGVENPASEITPPVGEAVWVYATLAPKAPFSLRVAGTPLASTTEIRDPALITVLTQLVGQAHLDQLRAGKYPSDSQAPSVAEETTRVARDYGLVSPLSSLLVRGTDGKPLAGRAVQVVPQVGPAQIMTLQPAPKAKPALEHCPDLIGLANQRLVDQSCPPLYVSFSQAEPRLIADVRFSGTEPQVPSSPHLAELAHLLALRPELSKVRVRASSKAHAEGVIRYLVGRGIARERLLAERLLDGSLPARRGTPRCVTPGQPVLLEVLGMSLLPLSSAIVKGAPLSESSAPSRLSSIEQALTRRAYDRDDAQLAQARQASERWVSEEPKNPVAYVALGDVRVALGDLPGAARAYGSLFDLDVPGAGLQVAAAMRLQRLTPLAPRSRERRESTEQRWWDLGIATYRKQWQDHRERFEASRALAYASLRADQRDEAFGALLEAAGYSPLSQRIELPLFAHFYSSQTVNAGRLLEQFLPRECLFPSHASVLGAALSWEDVDSELEVNVTSLAGKYGYESTLSEHGAAGGLKWIPLPEDDASYPLRISVRALRLSKNGYAFGALRTLNSLGTERVQVEEHPFVVTQAGEPLTLVNEQILQRPQ